MSARVQAIESNERNTDVSASTRLHEPWLTVFRVLWLGIALTTLVLFTSGLVTGLQPLGTVCSPPVNACHPAQLNPAEAEFNRRLGLSLDFYAWFTTLSNAVFGFGFLAVAWLIFLRRSNDWMALYVSLILITMGAGATPVVGRAYVWFFVFATANLFPLFALFPNGRFVPRWISWLVAGWFLYQILIYALHGIPARGISGGPPSPVTQLALLIGVGAQIYRYRRVSTPIERQQTKWVVFGFASWFVTLITLVMALRFFPDLGRSGSLANFVLNKYAFPFVGLLPLLFIPLSLGVSILRYRLWDIDFIIRRSVAYTLFTGALALGYLAGVPFFQWILPNQSAIGTVASTLLIAAFFTPLRQGIQSRIDRRFYRRKYDAERTLSEFGARIRDRVELADLKDELIEVVEKTMEPIHVSLWMAGGRPPEAR